MLRMRACRYRSCKCLPFEKGQDTTELWKKVDIELIALAGYLCKLVCNRQKPFLFFCFCFGLFIGLKNYQLRLFPICLHVDVKENELFLGGE